jgi:hypothetical protein
VAFVFVFFNYILPTVAVSGLAENGGFLWAIKIRNAHFLRRESKAVVPMSQIHGI